MFGLSFTQWMALIGGYPTIISTIMFFGVVGYAGTRAIYRHKDFKTIKFHIHEANRIKAEMKKELQTMDLVTRFFVKRLVSKKLYAELTYIETAPETPTLKNKLVNWYLEKKISLLLNKKRGGRHVVTIENQRSRRRNTG